MRGRIIRGIGGLYYVSCRFGDDAEGIGEAGIQGKQGGGLYECSAKGIFRREGKKPLVGDEVEIDVLDRDKLTGNIRELLPRRSELIRPAAANVDQALVIFAILQPRPSFNLLDRFLIMMGQRDIPCIICFNKLDLDENGDGERYARIYRGCGYPVLTVSARLGEGMEALKGMLEGKVTAVAGPSGAGKSSLINRLQPHVVMETGEISARIERGKHTTRHTELIPLGEESYILDTPGFSSLGLFDLKKEELAEYYPEFAQHERQCRFGGCAHIREQVCGVKDAVAQGDISKIRYDNYCLLYEELNALQSRGGYARVKRI